MASTNPPKGQVGGSSKGNPEGRGGATNSGKIVDSTRALGTKATNPTSKTGKPEGHEKGAR